MKAFCGMDLYSPQKRSAIMAKIKSKGNASTEMKFEALLNEHNIGGWEKHYKIIGNPDFVFSKLKIAIFIDGALYLLTALFGMAIKK